MGLWCVVDCHEEFAARRENWDHENQSANVVLRVKYAQHKIAIQDLLRWYRPYPFNVTNQPRLYAASVGVRMDRGRFDPVPPTEEAIVPRYDVLLDVTYRPLETLLYRADKVAANRESGSSPEGPPWLEGQFLHVDESMDIRVDFITFEHSQFWWRDGADCSAKNNEPLPVGSEGGWPFRRITITRTVRGFPTIPPNIENFEGRTHSAPYRSDILERDFDANTLLFTNPKISLDYANYYWNDPKGTNLTFTVSAELIWQKDGWNKFPRLVKHESENRVEIRYFDQCVQPKTLGNTKYPFEPYEPEWMGYFIFSNTNPANSGYIPQRAS